MQKLIPYSQCLRTHIGFCLFGYETDEMEVLEITQLTQKPHEFGRDETIGT